MFYRPSVHIGPGFMPVENYKLNTTYGTKNFEIFSRVIGLISRVFANGPGDWGSIPGWVIPKTQKMVLDASLHNTQHYKVRIKGKVEQSREWSSVLPYTSIEKGAFGSLSTKVTNFTYDNPCKNYGISILRRCSLSFFYFVINKLITTAKHFFFKG